MLIVTGGAGFIGSNLVHELNAHGISDILVVDNFAKPAKFVNLHGARYVDTMDKREFRRAIREGVLGTGKVEAILHQGACSNTLEDDGAYMMDNNCQYTKEVLAFAIREGAPLVFFDGGGLWAVRPGPLYAHARERAAAEHLRVFQACVRSLLPQPVGAGPRADDGGGPALLQCLRPARAAQRAHGVRGPPLFKTNEGDGKGAAVSRNRRLRRRRAAQGFCLRARPGADEYVLRADRSLRVEGGRGDQDLPRSCERGYRREPQF